MIPALEAAELICIKKRAYSEESSEHIQPASFFYQSIYIPAVHAVQLPVSATGLLVNRDVPSTAAVVRAFISQASEMLT